MAKDKSTKAEEFDPVFGEEASKETTLTLEPEPENKEVQEVQSKPKKWSITLIESRSYSHSKQKFTSGRAYVTSDESLAEDLKNNSYFKVQEI